VKLERNVDARPPGRRIDRNAWVMAGVLLALWGVLAVMPASRGTFLTAGNLGNLLTQNAYILVVAVGMTLAILIRGIDLSVGSGVALTGAVAALLQDQLGLGAPLAIAAALAAGAVIGLWHGLWIARFGLPAFIVTLAGLKAFRSVALVGTEARAVTMGPDFRVLNGALPVSVTWAIVLGALAAGVALALRDAARRKRLGLEPTTTGVIATRLGGYAALAGFLLYVFGGRGMPVQVLIAGAVALAAIALTRRTRFGRHLYAIGGNPEAARLSGIAVGRVTVTVYVVLGILTAIAGVMLAARVGGVTAGSTGKDLELDAITAVVIGGTSLLGGRGSIVGTVLGVLVVGTLAQCMTLLGIDSNWQGICTGLMLLVAVLIDVLLKGRRS
jgi:D-xylose transport system permease protein